MKILLSAFCLLLSALVLSCSKGDAAEASKGGSGKRGSMEFPVEVRPVESRRVEYSVNAVGSLDAFERVAVTARVAGAVDHVRFSEGQVIDRGTVLVEID